MLPPFGLCRQSLVDVVSGCMLATEQDMLSLLVSIATVMLAIVGGVSSYNAIQALVLCKI